MHDQLDAASPVASWGSNQDNASQTPTHTPIRY